MLDEAQEEVGRVVYDGFGGVLSSTLEVDIFAPQGVNSGQVDAGTGLVHLGNGRFYAPALGRPLQPHSAAAPPTIPQALNRYAATPVGQPGVHPALIAARNQIPGAVVGNLVEDIAQHYLAKTFYKQVPTGYAIVQLQGTVRSMRFLDDGLEVVSVQLAKGFFRKPFSYLFPSWRIQTSSGRMWVGTTADEIANFRIGMVGRNVNVISLSRQFDTIVDDVATTASRQAAGTIGKAGSTVIGGLISAGIQYASDYNDPFLTGWQKAGRAGISGIGAGTAGIIGFALGGPVGAIAVGFLFEYAAAPRIFQFTGLIPQRNLKSLSID